MANLSEEILLSTIPDMPTLAFGTGQINLEQTLDNALRIGYRHIDCADGYSRNPDYSNGRSYYDIIKKGIKSVTRNQLWITWKTDDSITIEDIKLVISRLECSYIDLYLIHHGCGSDRTFEVLNEAVRQKLIRFYGVSNCEDYEKLREIKSKYNIYANQVQARAPNGRIISRDRLDFNDFVKKCNDIGIRIMLFASVSAVSNQIFETGDYDLIEHVPNINPYYLQKYVFNKMISRSKVNKLLGTSVLFESRLEVEGLLKGLEVFDPSEQTLEVEGLLKGLEVFDPYEQTLEVSPHVPVLGEVVNCLIVGSTKGSTRISPTSLEINMETHNRLTRQEVILNEEQMNIIEKVLESKVFPRL
jgi:diketogulonate reductase-like aldo/keto reductase